MIPGGRKGGGLVAQADAQRAAGAWGDAARLYAAHLAAAPEDWAIWIQHGHCAREAGDPAAALASYRRAEAGRPWDAELQLHLGRALRLTGDAAGARVAFARALELDPRADAAWQEVMRLLVTQDAGEPGLSLVGDLRIVFDVSDLFSWFGTHRAASGIQRIQMEIAEGARGGAAELRFAVFRAGLGTWREMPQEAFRRLVALSRSGADATDPAWQDTRAQVDGLLDAMPDLVFGDGTWLVNLGTAWHLDGYHLAVRAAKEAQGVRYAALVHDAGPVTLPEHSPPEVTARFAQWFAGLGLAADLVLAVSAATRAEVERLAALHLPGLPFAPVRVLRPDAAPPTPPRGEHPRLPDLLAEPFILFVATIESRKDHLFVLNAWLALLRRHGAAIPRLLLVGRAGFGAEPAIALLIRAPALDGRVVWLDDVPDGALAALRARCLFAIHHAAHEGWGLPVTEALAAGKAVVAPAHSGLLESAQGLALTYAPGSEPGFIEAVERLLFEPGALDAQEIRIAEELRLRDWGAVAQELCEALQDTPPRDDAPPAPPLGMTHPMGLPALARPSLALAWGEMLRAGRAWHAPEPWGCWTRPGRALLRLPLPSGSGPLRLHLALRGAPTAREVMLRIGRGPRVPLMVPADGRPVAVLDIPAGLAAEVAIEVTVTPDDPAPAIGIGVIAAMACAPGDVAARLEFLERLTFVWPDAA